LDFPAVELSFPASVDTGDRNCGRQQKAYQITGEASASVGGEGSCAREEADPRVLAKGK